MIDEAKDTMAQIIEGLPDDLQVALRVYGHRIREGQRGDCQDSELVFPFATLDKPRLLGGCEPFKHWGQRRLPIPCSRSNATSARRVGRK